MFSKLFGKKEEVSEEATTDELVAGEEEEQEEGGELAVDVYQDKDNVVLKSTIAGVSPDDLDISLTSDTVIIKGERRRSEEVTKEDYFYQECYYGRFARSLMLPVEIDVDKARAELKDGILTLTLPKASRARTKKVKVKGSEE